MRAVVRGAVVGDVDEEWLAERRRLGLDRFDEMWESELHMAPPPKRRHQGLVRKLGEVLGPAASRAGCDIYPQAGVYATAEDYRVPDLVVVAPSSESERGVDGPPLAVIEILSPHDESVAKVPWYFGRGAGSVALIDPSTYAVEVFTHSGRSEADADGLFVIPGLEARIGPSVDGRALLVETADGIARIEV